MNTVDVARSRGIVTDYEQLARLLSVPMLQTVGIRGEGMQALLDTAVRVAANEDPVSRHIHVHYGSELEEEIAKIRGVLRRDPELTARYYPRWTALKLLENDPLVKKAVAASPASAEIIAQVEDSRRHLARIFEDDPETLVAEARYGFISWVLKETVSGHE